VGFVQIDVHGAGPVDVLTAAFRLFRFAGSQGTKSVPAYREKKVAPIDENFAFNLGEIPSRSQASSPQFLGKARDAGRLRDTAVVEQIGLGIGR